MAHVSQNGSAKQDSDKLGWGWAPLPFQGPELNQVLPLIPGKGILTNRNQVLCELHLGRWWSLVHSSNPPPSLAMLSVFRRRGSWSLPCYNPLAGPRLSALTVPEWAAVNRGEVLSYHFLHDVQESSERSEPGWEGLICMEAAKTETKDGESWGTVGSPSESGWGQGLAGSLPLPAL